MAVLCGLDPDKRHVSLSAARFLHVSVSLAVKRSRLVNLPVQLEHGHW